MGEKLTLGSENTILNPQTMQRGNGAPLHPFTAAHPLNLETGLGRSLSLADTPSRMLIKNKRVLKVFQVQLVHNGYSQILKQQLFHRQKNPWSRP